jgi:hypothetical protein
LRRLVSPKRRLTFNALNGVVFQKRELVTHHTGLPLCNICIPYGSVEVSAHYFREENLAPTRRDERLTLQPGGELAKLQPTLRDKELFFSVSR